MVLDYNRQFLLANLVFGIAGQMVGEISYGFTFFLAAVLACAVAIWRFTIFFVRELIILYFAAGRCFFEHTNGIFTKLQLICMGIN